MRDEAVDFDWVLISSIQDKRGLFIEDIGWVELRFIGKEFNAIIEETGDRFFSLEGEDMNGVLGEFTEVQFKMRLIVLWFGHGYLSHQTYI
jgi:hypothetical protein